MYKKLSDKDYMLRAIDLAKKGMGYTRPNPLVGAVIVKDGRIIGEGCHEKYGDLHAERNAIKNLTESAEGATIYVTLEPCCHHGKQPPCTEAIVENRIAKVVIGSRDPNPLVSGKGTAYLREHGIIVEEDFMREECDELNPVFFHYITTGLPYVVMKYAMTLDGKIATRTGESKWITGEKSRMEVQEMRHRYRGIMVGIGTVLADDPMLNVRIEGKRSPIRIICDSSLKIPLDCRICKTAKDYRTIIACAKADENKKEQLKNLGIQIIEVPDVNNKVDLSKLMKELGSMKIDSILLEGGGTLNDSMMRAGLINEIKAFVAPKIFGGVNAKSPVAGTGFAHVDEGGIFKLNSIRQFDDDVLLEYRR